MIGLMMGLMMLGLMMLIGDSPPFSVVAVGRQWRQAVAWLATQTSFVWTSSSATSWR